MSTDTKSICVLTADVEDDSLYTLTLSRPAHDHVLNADASLLRRAFENASDVTWSINGPTFHGLPSDLQASACEMFSGAASKELVCRAD